MINTIIQEINMCLEHKCYLSALTSALTLPDVCGKAEYPNLRIGNRYKKWYETFVYSKQTSGIRMPKEALYDLRCNLLHTGTPALSKTKNIKKFALIIRENSAYIPLESSLKRTDNNGSITFQIYNVNLIYLCQKLCESALNYYQANKDKFSFNYRIVSATDATCLALNIPNVNIL